MEDAVAYYFSTDAGQALLDGIEGEFNLKEWRRLANVRMALVTTQVKPITEDLTKKKDGEFDKVGLQDLTEYTEQF